MTYSEILNVIQDQIEEDNLYRIRLKGETRHREDLENFLRENLSAFYFEIQNDLVDSFEEYEIEDKYLIELFKQFCF